MPSYQWRRSNGWKSSYSGFIVWQKTKNRDAFSEKYRGLDLSLITVPSEKCWELCVRLIDELCRNEKG